MKEPKKHREAGYPIDDGEDTTCVWDGQPWPCKTYRKWLKSDSYRIALLEEKLDVLISSAGRHRKEIDSLKYTAKFNAAIVNALLLYVNKGGGNIEVSETQDVMNFRDTNSTRTVQIAGRKDFKVTYSNDKQIWVNGILTEMRS